MADNSLLFHCVSELSRKSHEDKIMAVMVDIDGTILVEDDDPFYVDNGFDVIKPIEPVCNLIRSLHDSGFSVLFLTSRTRNGKRLAIKHVNECLPELDGDFRVFMRDTDDDRRSAECKVSVYHDEIEQEYDVRLFLDNEPENVEAFRQIGICSILV